MDCILRQWKKEDARNLANLLNNKKILDNLCDGLPFPYTESDAQNFIGDMLKADKNSIFAFCIVFESKVVGCISGFRQNNIFSQSAEIGYYVDEFYWNKGVATFAVKTICKYIFVNTDIIRIFATPFARNLPSCKVLEKSGFICEGTLRSGAVKNGKTEDIKIYAKIKSS